MAELHPNNWEPFWYETNLAFGPCHSREEWDGMVAKQMAYTDYRNETWLLANSHLAVRSRSGSGLPDYGGRSEHTGDKTLGEFFEEHGMMPSSALRGEQSYKSTPTDTLDRDI